VPGREWALSFRCVAHFGCGLFAERTITVHQVDEEARWRRRGTKPNKLMQVQVSDTTDADKWYTAGNKNCFKKTQSKN
jgi:hypothetical protein